MSEIKFSAISVELSRRLGDPVATANLGGTWLTAAVRTAYVNKALHKFFTDMLASVKGDVQKFINIFPELLSPPTSLTLSSGSYTVSTGAANIKDIWKIWQAYTATTLYHIAVLDESLYSTMVSGVNTDFQASATHPAVIQISGVLQFFPLSSTFTPMVIYIKLPINPTDGSLLTQGGTYDSPFGYQWNSQIAETAQKLFLIDHQKGA